MLVATSDPAGGSSAVLLYDGSCGFCARSVRFILRHEHQHTLRFAPLDGTLGTTLRQRHPELAHVDSMIWIDDPLGEHERVLVRSDAVLRVAEYLGGVWTGARVGRWLPASWRNAVYDLVARHRLSLLPSEDMCALPTADNRGRFIP